MGRYQESLKRSLQCLDTIDLYTEKQLTNKAALKAQLYSCIGNAYLEMGQYDKALANHLVDYNIGEGHNVEEAVSRGMDNLGRVYARKGNFLQAIKVWEAKLPISKMPLETTWLCHEIGRCYLELRMYSKAKDYGQQCLTAALEAQDASWKLHGYVLMAQAAVKLEEYQSALSSFRRSLELTTILQDRLAEGVIKKAMAEIRARMTTKGPEDAKDTLHEVSTNPKTAPESTSDAVSQLTPQPTQPSTDPSNGGERAQAPNSEDNAVL